MVHTLESNPWQQDHAADLLYRMKWIRCIEETIAGKYGEGKMRCPVHLSIGQEAVSAAVGKALRKEDYAVSGHRAHGHYLGKGGDPQAMLAEIYGKRSGCARGKGGSMHLIDETVGFKGSTAIVGGTIPIGVGLGYSISCRKSDQVSCVFFGDGAVEEGAFYESANFAALHKLPVLFLCENNFYSVYSSLRPRQPEGREIYKMVEGMGIESAQGDGNNVLEVFDTVASALKDIRSGRGPRFLEFKTYRWREHCGPNFDNDIGYRTEEEYLSWKARDPVAQLTSDLISKNQLYPATVSEMDGEIQSQVDQFFTFVENSPFPDPKEAYQDLFAPDDFERSRL